jgi:hypothetical protein
MPQIRAGGIPSGQAGDVVRQWHDVIQEFAFARHSGEFDGQKVRVFLGDGGVLPDVLEAGFEAGIGRQV